MDDAKFKELDDKLFDLINPFLANGDQNFSINNNQEIFNWYCDIRNKIIDKVDEKIGWN